MRVWCSAFQVLAGSCLFSLGATACGSGDGSGSQGGAAASANRAGTSGNGGPNLGNLGGSGNGFGGSGDPGDTCAGELIEAKHIPLDMYVMLDSSGSMLDSTEGDPALSKWQAVSAALAEFVGDPASAGMGIGLQTFPITHPDAPAECTTNAQCGPEFGPCFLRACWPPENGFLTPCGTGLDCASFRCVTFGECANDPAYVCPEVGAACGFDGALDLGDCVTPPPSFCLFTDDCRSATYASPAAPIAELPAASAAVLAAVASTEPGGLTPSGPALTGALEQARAWALAHADHRVVAVLATDGLPTLQAAGEVCEPITEQAEVDAVAQLAATGLAGTPSITTFVIGVMGPNDVGGPETLDAIAQAGGTTEAFIVDTQGNVASQFRDALNAIRGSRLSCDLLVPQAEAGRTVDYDFVNVTFDDGSGPRDLDHVGERSDCHPSTGGWYFDVDPAQGTPERILICPTSCGEFEATGEGSVQIRLGCRRRDVVK